MTRCPELPHRFPVQCHACGAERVLAAGERIGFRETCEGCDADLHTCLDCRFHDPSAYNECHESSAERVADRDRANRCDYFVPAEAGDSGGRPQAEGGGRAEIDALFKKP